MSFGKLNILMHKSWNVWNRDNIEKVRLRRPPETSAQSERPEKSAVNARPVRRPDMLVCAMASWATRRIAHSPPCLLQQASAPPFPRPSLHTLRLEPDGCSAMHTPRVCAWVILGECVALRQLANPSRGLCPPPPNPYTLNTTLNPTPQTPNPELSHQSMPARLGGVPSISPGACS